jgi:enoyl-CoA hydratase/carnithine racemase
MASDKNLTSRETPAGLKIQRAGDVVTLTLDNPAEANRVTGAMLDAMLDMLRSEATDPSARVLVIRAQGDVFCTGRERAGRDVASIRQESARILEFKRALRTTSLISIAAVQGDAMGFGFGLAIVCDFVVVADHASLGFPEMRSDLAPAAIMSYLGDYTLPRFAFPMVLFGDPIDPQRALQIGLISQVSIADRLNDDVNSLVQRILKLDPTAARKCKEFFNVAAQNSFEQNCRLATEVLTVGSLCVLAREK